MVSALIVIFVLIIVVSVGSVLVAKQLPVSKGSIPLLVNQEKLKTKDIPNLSGKVFLITGANAGLGFSSTKFLAGAGATCIMCCRSIEKAKNAKKAIVEQIEATKDKKNFNFENFEEGNMVEMVLDLGSLESIKSFAQEFLANFDRLDCLMLNAGIMATPYGLTENGIEQQFGVNHVGHFYLTHLLLPLLKASQPCSIVSVSSAGHNYSHPKGIMQSLDAINEKSTYNPALHYGQSKLANILFAKELSKRLQEEGLEIYVNAIHPGVVATELARHLPKNAQDIFYWVDKNLPNKVVFTPDAAALTQIYAAIAPVFLEKPFTGKYLVPIGEECQPHKHGMNKDLQGHLWKMTESILEEKGFPI